MGEFANVEEVIQGARNALKLARLGSDMFQKGGTGTQREAGLANAVVFGRAVTNVLERIRTFHRATFNDWYKPRSAAMSADPAFKYLYELRSEILKEGRKPATRSSMYISHFSSGEIASMPRPPGATAFFMGDALGGAGWHVQVGNELERFYVDPPPGVQTWTAFGAPAGRAKPVAAPTETIHSILERYIAHLEEFVDSAEAEFGHK